MTSKAYSNPPITEAVIGINFSQPIGSDALAALSEKFAQVYPHHEQIQNLSIKLELGQQNAGNPSLAQDVQIGYRRSTADMTEMLVLFSNGIGVSQLAPYPGWDTFFERFARDWKLLKRQLGYKEIQRIGVRYINRIDIPTEAGQVLPAQYLNLHTNFTDRFGSLAAYAVQAEVIMEDLGSKLVVNSGVVPSPVLDHISFLLDQDIGREVNVPQKDEAIFELIQQLRVRKNEVFESCVTDQARALFHHDK